MNRTRLAAALAVLFAFTVTTQVCAWPYYRTVTVRRAYSSYPYSSMSLGEALAFAGVSLGLIGLVAYLGSESESQKQARLEREHQKQAMIAAMTPAQREVYYAEERLKIEKEKAAALQQQANAVWWNTYINPLLAPAPTYVVEETVYY